MEKRNIFAQIPENLPEEFVEIIADSKSVTIEKIVSRGHCSADGFWYNQEKNEFVILLSGEATIRFKENDSRIKLSAGDFISISANVDHRVESTSSTEDSVWLAVHY